VVTRVAVLVVLSLSAACGEMASPRPPLYVTPTSVTLYPGNTTQLEISDARGVSWYIDDPRIASVDANGFVRALNPGIGTVWAVRGSDSAAATIEVARIKCLLSPQMAPTNVALAPGDTVRVEAWDGCTSVGGVFAWESRDSSVATVIAREATSGRSTAVVQARRVGQAVIVARLIADPTADAALAVTVRAP
jgi:uncharacterized protein YjdB